jgi:hypothetical protein
MPCYFQGCARPVTSKEHIPPQSFFPKDQREQLLTVPSCDQHNGEKSSDDVYALAHICLNSSPSNRSREIFEKRIVPQLDYNNDALRKMLADGSVAHPSGAVSYPVDVPRLSRFFTALSCGIVFKACRQPLPGNYTVNHVYHNFVDKNEPTEMKAIKQMLLSVYSGEPTEILNFGQVKTLNKTIYTAKMFGVRNFGSSITVSHEFYGVFRVTSMLTLRPRKKSVIEL